MTFASSLMEPAEHLAAAAAVCVIVVAQWQGARWRSTRAVRTATAVAALPLLFVPFPDAIASFVLGKEGLVEAVTAGILAGLVWQAARSRQAWVGLGAVAVLLEELDYGQWFSRLATPEWLAAAGSGSGNLNTHNLPYFEAAWRLLPLGCCVALALRDRWPPPCLQLGQSLGLPKLHPSLAAVVPVLLVLAGASALLVSGDAADEAAELSAVMLVALAWRAEEA